MCSMCEHVIYMNIYVRVCYVVCVCVMYTKNHYEAFQRLYSPPSHEKQYRCSFVLSG